MGLRRGRQQVRRPTKENIPCFRLRRAFKVAQISRASSVCFDRGPGATGMNEVVSPPKQLKLRGRGGQQMPLAVDVL